MQRESKRGVSVAAWQPHLARREICATAANTEAHLWQVEPVSRRTLCWHCVVHNTTNTARLCSLYLRSQTELEKKRGDFFLSFLLLFLFFF